MRRVARDDRGSVALAVLLVVMIGAMIPLVLASTVAEQRVTRVDRDSGIALEAADAGLQDARYRLINRIVQPSDPLPVTVTGSVNGVPFTWSGRPDPALSTTAQAAGLSWRVVSRGGRPGGVQRTVTAYLTQRSLFEHGLFLSNMGSFAGGNRIDSYNAAASPVWDTKKGTVGSNNSLAFEGGFLADRVYLYDWATNSSAGRCAAAGNSGTTGHCTLAPSTGATTSARRFNVGPRFPLPQQLAQAENQLASPTCPQHGHWSSSSLPLSGGNRTFNLPAGTPLCFSSITFNANTVFPPSSVPYRLYVSGKVTVVNGVHVNCTGCGSYPPATPPTASRVLIVTPGTGVVFEAQAQARLAAAIYAPRGTCQGGGGSVEVYGSLMCESGVSLGNWQWHYDEAVGDVQGTGEFVVTRWDESPGATL